MSIGGSTYIGTGNFDGRMGKGVSKLSIFITCLIDCQIVGSG